MIDALSHISFDVLPIASGLGVVIMFYLLGQSTANWRLEPVVAVATGWGLVATIFTIVGVFTTINFSILAFACYLAAVFGLGFRVWRNGVNASLVFDWKPLALVGSLLIIVSGMIGSQWDEFSHWLIALNYLYDFDMFPGRGGPESMSPSSAYPNGWPLASYLGASLTQDLRESIPVILNVLLLGMLGGLFAKLTQDHITGKGERSPIVWPLVAVGVLCATILNPTFVSKIVFTAYADNATAVFLAVLAITGWLIAEALLSGGHDRIQANLIVYAFCGAAMISLKPGNLVLYLLVTISVAILLVRIRPQGEQVKKFGFKALFAISLPLFVYFVWKFHVDQNLVGRELSIRPFEKWHVDAIPEILERMALVASKKGGYFLMMFAVTVGGVVGFIRPSSPLRRFAVVGALIFLGYNAFLVFTYVAAFGREDALRVASYWRYNTHLGLVGTGITLMAFAGYCASKWPHHRNWRRLAPVPLILALIVPLVLVKKIRFDVDSQKIYTRTVAKEIVGLLPEGDTVFLLDPRGSGLSGMMLLFESRNKLKFGGKFTSHYSSDEETISNIRQMKKIDHIWVLNTDEATAKVFSIENNSPASYLFSREEDGEWRLGRDWPYPDNRLPDDYP